METIKYKDFLGSVEVSMKDDCIHGKILFINDLVTYESETLSGIKKEFKEAVDDYIETCKELGIEPLKSFSGSFNVRIGPELHQKLASKAIQANKNINSLVKDAIESHLNDLNGSKEVHHHHNINISIEKSANDFLPEEITSKQTGKISFLNEYREQK